MTVETTTAKSGPYAGAGTVGPFTVGFRFLDNSHLRVIKTNLLGVDSTLILDTDYTVTGAGDLSGSLTLTAVLPSGYQLTIVRSVPATQLADYVQNDAFPARSHEDSLDKLTMIAQEQGGSIARAIVFPESEIPSQNTVLPTALNRAFKYLMFDSLGRMFMSTGTGTDQGLRSDLFSSIGSTLVSFIQSLTGAVSQTVKQKFSGYVSPLDFMSTAMKDDVLNGTLAMDHTAAVQLAINSGRNVDLCGLSYKVNNLTQTISNQSITSSQGIAKLIKNANGPILTSTAAFNFRMQNISGFGDASTPVYTGDGFVATGNSPLFDNCGCRWIAGRALKATGSNVTVRGTCDIYQTTDLSVTGYDIEIGVSGTATLYHMISGIYTSHREGGILLTDVGAHTIMGGMFGKYTVAKGTGPAGVNGGKLVGARVLGDILIQLSSAVLTGNIVDNVNLTFDVLTSGCRFDESNTCANSFTSTDNGNTLSNYIAQVTSTGSTGLRTLTYGASTGATRAWSMNPTDTTTAWQPDGAIVLPNTYGYRIRDNAAVAQTFIALSNTNQASIGTANYPVTYLAGTSAGFFAGGATICQVVSGAFRPFTDNNILLGTASLRWNTVYAGTGTINTSDERLKQQWRSQSEAEKAAALAIKSNIGLYKFNDAVAEKGDGARWHVGVKAQQVVAIMQSHGLDALTYAFVCYDEWDEVPEIKHDAQLEIIEDGCTIQEAKPETIEQCYIAAGNRYGIRYDELAMFILSAI